MTLMMVNRIVHCLKVMLIKMKWEVNKYGIHCHIDDQTLLKPIAHFAKDYRLVSLVNTFGNDSVAINMHTAIGLDGVIYREDLCVSFKDKLDSVHPTIML